MAFQSKAYTIIFLSLMGFTVSILFLFASLVNNTSSQTGPLFFEDMDQARQFHRECLDANGVVKTKGTVYGVELTCYGVELKSKN